MTSLLEKITDESNDVSQDEFKDLVESRVSVIDTYDDSFKSEAYGNLAYERKLASQYFKYKKLIDSSSDPINKDGLKQKLNNYKSFLKSDRSSDAYKSYIDGNKVIDDVLSSKYKAKGSLFNKIDELSHDSSVYAGKVQNAEALISEVPDSSDPRFYKNNQDSVARGKAALEKLNEFLDMPDDGKKFDWRSFDEVVKSEEFDSIFSSGGEDENGKRLPRDPEEVKAFYSEKNWNTRINKLLKEDEDEVAFHRNEFNNEVVPSHKFWSHGKEEAKSFLDEAVKNDEINKHEADKILEAHEPNHNRVLKQAASDVMVNVSDTERAVDLTKAEFYAATPFGGKIAVAGASITSEYDIKTLGGAKPQEILDTWGERTPEFDAGYRKIIDEQGWFGATLSKGMKTIRDSFVDTGYGINALTGYLDRDVLVDEYASRNDKSRLDSLVSGESSDFVAEVIGITPSLAMSMGSGAAVQAGIRSVVQKRIMKEIVSEGIKKGVKQELKKRTALHFATKAAQDEAKGFFRKALANRGGAILGSSLGGAVESGSKTYASMLGEVDANGDLVYSEGEALEGAMGAFITTGAVTLVLGPSGKESIFKKAKNFDDFAASIKKSPLWRKRAKALLAAGFEGGKDMVSEGIEEYLDETIQGLWQGYINGDFDEHDWKEKVGQVFKDGRQAFLLGVVAGGIGGAKSAHNKFSHANQQYTKAYNAEVDARFVDIESYSQKAASLIDNYDKNVSKSVEAARKKLAESSEKSLEIDTQEVMQEVESKLKSDLDQASSDSALDGGDLTRSEKLLGAEAAEADFRRSRAETQAIEVIANDKASQLEAMQEEIDSNDAEVSEGKIDYSKVSFDQDAHNAAKSKAEIAARVAENKRLEHNKLEKAELAKKEAKKKKSKQPVVGTESKEAPEATPTTEDSSSTTEAPKTTSTAEEIHNTRKALNIEKGDTGRSMSKDDKEALSKVSPQRTPLVSGVMEDINQLDNNLRPQHNGRLRDYDNSSDVGDGWKYMTAEKAVALVNKAQAKLDKFDGKTDKDKATVEILQRTIDNSKVLLNDIYNNGGKVLRGRVGLDKNKQASFDETMKKIKAAQGDTVVDFSVKKESSSSAPKSDPVKKTTQRNNATGNDVAPEISKNRPDTKDTIKELRDRGMEAAAKGHESLDSSEANLSPKLAKKVGREGSVAERATEIFEGMDTDGMTEDQLHQVRHQAWAEAILEENNPDLNDVMAAHEEIASGFNTNPKQVDQTNPVPDLTGEESKSSPKEDDDSSGSESSDIDVSGLALNSGSDSVDPVENFLSRADDAVDELSNKALFASSKLKDSALKDSRILNDQIELARELIADGASKSDIQEALNEVSRLSVALRSKLADVKTKVSQENAVGSYFSQLNFESYMEAITDGGDISSILANSYVNPYTGVKASSGRSFNLNSAKEFVRQYERSNPDTIVEFGGKKTDLKSLPPSDLMDFYHKVMDDMKAKVSEDKRKVPDKEKIRHLSSQDNVKGLMQFMAYRYASADIAAHKASEALGELSESKTSLPHRENRVKDAHKILSNLANGKTSTQKAVNSLNSLIASEKVFDNVRIVGGNTQQMFVEPKIVDGKLQTTLVVSKKMLLHMGGSKKGRSLFENPNGKKRYQKTIDKLDQRAHYVLKGLEEEMHHAVAFKKLVVSKDGKINFDVVESMGRKIMTSPAALAVLKESYFNQSFERDLNSTLIKLFPELNTPKAVNALKKLTSDQKSKEEKEVAIQLAVELLAAVGQQARSGLSAGDISRVLIGETSSSSNAVSEYLASMRNQKIVAEANLRKLNESEELEGDNDSFDYYSYLIDQSLIREFGWVPVQADHVASLSKKGKFWSKLKPVRTKGKKQKGENESEWIHFIKNGVTSFNRLKHNPLESPSDASMEAKFYEKQAKRIKEGLAEGDFDASGYVKIYKDYSSAAISLYEEARENPDLLDDPEFKQIVNAISDAQYFFMNHFDKVFTTSDGGVTTLSQDGIDSIDRMGGLVALLEDKINTAAKAKGDGNNEFKELNKQRQKNESLFKKMYLQNMEAQFESMPDSMPKKIKNAVGVLTDLNAYANAVLGVKGQYKVGMISFNHKTKEFELRYKGKLPDADSSNKDRNKTVKGARYVLPTQEKVDEAIKTLNEDNFFDNLVDNRDVVSRNLNRAAVALDAGFSRLQEDGVELPLEALRSHGFDSPTTMFRGESLEDLVNFVDGNPDLMKLLPDEVSVPALQAVKDYKSVHDQADAFAKIIVMVDPASVQKETNLVDLISLGNFPSWVTDDVKLAGKAMLANGHSPKEVANRILEIHEQLLFKNEESFEKMDRFGKIQIVDFAKKNVDNLISEMKSLGVSLDDSKDVAEKIKDIIDSSSNRSVDMQRTVDENLLTDLDYIKAVRIMNNDLVSGYQLGAKLFIDHQGVDSDVEFAMRRNDPLAPVLGLQYNADGYKSFSSRSELVHLRGLIKTSPIHMFGEHRSRDIPLPVKLNKDGFDVSSFNQGYTTELRDFLLGKTFTNEITNEKGEKVQEVVPVTNKQGIDWWLDNNDSISEEAAAIYRLTSPLFTQREKLLDAISGVELAISEFGYGDLKFNDDGTPILDPYIEVEPDGEIKPQSINLANSNYSNYAKKVKALHDAVRGLNSDIYSSTELIRYKDNTYDTEYSKKYQNIKNDRAIDLPTSSEALDWVESNWPNTHSGFDLFNSNKWKNIGTSSDPEIVQVPIANDETVQSRNRDDLDRAKDIRDHYKEFGVKRSKSEEATVERVVAYMSAYLESRGHGIYNLRMVEEMAVGLLSKADMAGNLSISDTMPLEEMEAVYGDAKFSALHEVLGRLAQDDTLKAKSGNLVKAENSLLGSNAHVFFNGGASVFNGDSVENEDVYKSTEEKIASKIDKRLLPAYELEMPNPTSIKSLSSFIANNDRVAVNAEIGRLAKKYPQTAAKVVLEALKESSSQSQFSVDVERSLDQYLDVSNGRKSTEWLRNKLNKVSVNFSKSFPLSFYDLMAEAQKLNVSLKQKLDEQSYLSSMLKELGNLSEGQRNGFGNHLNPDELSTLLEYITDLSPDKKSVETLDSLLRVENTTGVHGAEAAIGMIGDSLVGEFDVPVHVFDSKSNKLPDDLKYKTKSGLVLDNAGDLVAIVLDSDASVGKAGLDTGLQSIIHDLVRYKLERGFAPNGELTNDTSFVNFVSSTRLNLSVMGTSREVNKSVSRAFDSLKGNIESLTSSLAVNQYVDVSDNLSITKSVVDEKEVYIAEFKTNSLTDNEKAIKELSSGDNNIIDFENKAFVKKSKAVIKDAYSQRFEAITKSAERLTGPVGDGVNPLEHMFREMSNSEFLHRLMFDHNLQYLIDMSFSSTLSDFDYEGSLSSNFPAVNAIVDSLNYNREIQATDFSDSAIDGEMFPDLGNLAEDPFNTYLRATTLNSDVKIKGDNDIGEIQGFDYKSSLDRSEGYVLKKLISLAVSAIDSTPVNSSVKAVSGRDKYAKQGGLIKKDGKRPTRKINPIRRNDFYLSPRYREVLPDTLPVHLNDIFNGKADEIVKLDRWRAGREGVYLQVLDADSFDTLSFDKLGEIKSKDARLTFIRGGGIFDVDSDTYQERYQPRFGVVTKSEEKVAAETIDNLKKPNISVVGSNDKIDFFEDVKRRHESQLSSYKELIDVHKSDMARGRQRLDDIKETIALVEALEDQRVDAIKDGNYSLENTVLDSINNEMRKMVKGELPNASPDVLKSFSKSREALLKKLNDKFRFETVNNRRNKIGHLKAIKHIERQIENIEESSMDLSLGRDAFYQELADDILLANYEDRVREQIKEVKKDHLKNPTKDSELKKSELKNYTSFDKFLNESINNKGISDGQLGGFVLDAISRFYDNPNQSDIDAYYSRHPILNPRDLLENKSNLNFMLDNDDKSSVYSNNRTQTFGNENIIFYNSGSQVVAKTAVSGLTADFGREISKSAKAASAKEQQYYQAMLAANNKSFKALPDDSGVKGSIHKILATLTDYKHSGGVDPDIVDRIESALSYIHGKDGLHGFMANAYGIISDVFGSYWGSMVHTGMHPKWKRKWKRLNKRKDSAPPNVKDMGWFGNIDADISHFFSKDTAAGELGHAIIGMIDMGLGVNGGRNKAEFDGRRADKEVSDMIGSLTETKSNEAYTAALFSVYEDNLRGKGTAEDVEISVREQIEHNIFRIEEGVNLNGEITGKKVGNFKRSIERGDVVNQIAKAKAFLKNNPSLDGKELADKLDAHMLGGLSSSQKKFISDSRKYFEKSRKEIAVLGEVGGFDTDSYGYLSRKINNFLPMSEVSFKGEEAVTGKVEGEKGKFADRASKANAHSMYEAADKRLERADKVKESGNYRTLNLNAFSALSSSRKRTLYFINTAIEYEFTDRLFGVDAESNNAVSAFADSAIQPNHGLAERQMLNTAARFFRDRINHIYNNDVRVMYDRGFVFNTFKKGVSASMMKSLMGIDQPAKQTFTALAGATMMNPKNLPKGLLNYGKVASGTAIDLMRFVGKALNSNQEALTDYNVMDDLRKLQSIAAPHFLNRAVNGMQEIEIAFSKMSRKDVESIRDALSYGGNSLGGALSLIPKSMLHLFVTLPDITALNSVYLTEVERRIPNVSIKEIAADPSKYMKQLTLARVSTEAVMAQSDTSKMGAAFQAQENSWFEAGRTIVTPWTRQLASMGAHSRAGISLILRGNAKTKAKGVSLVANFVGQNAIYHSANIVALNFLFAVSGELISLISNGDEEDRDEEAKGFKKQMKLNKAEYDKIVDSLGDDKSDGFSPAAMKARRLMEENKDLEEALLVLEAGDFDDRIKMRQHLLNKRLQSLSFYTSPRTLSRKEFVGKVSMGVATDSLAGIAPIASITQIKDMWGLALDEAQRAVATARQDGTLMDDGDQYYDRENSMTYNPARPMYGENIAERGLNVLTSTIGSQTSVPTSIYQTVNRQFAASKSQEWDWRNGADLGFAVMGPRNMDKFNKNELNKRAWGWGAVRDDGYAYSGKQYHIHNHLWGDKPKDGFKAPALFAPEPKPRYGGFFKTSDLDPSSIEIKDSGNLVFGNNDSPKGFKVIKSESIRIKERSDADSILFHRSPLFMSNIRINGVDAFEKDYDHPNDFGQYLRQSSVVDLDPDTMQRMGKEARAYVDELLSTNPSKVYISNIDANNGRNYGYIEVDVDGERVDLGVLLVSKGLALVRGGDKILNPPNMSRNDYISLLKRAEAEAKKKSLGYHSYSNLGIR